MRLDYKLELRQTQKLLMTPQLRQAIKLLQLPVLELSQYLDQQYLDNPMLDLEEEEYDGEEAEEDIFDIDWEQYFQDREADKPISREQEGKATFEHFTSGDKTLPQQLRQQLILFCLPQRLVEIAEYIIDNLDDRGYLELSCRDIASQLQVVPGEVSLALNIVQSLEPAGIGARDLRECLLLQLRTRENVPPFTWEIVCQHLDMVAKGRIPVLAEIFNAQNAEIQAAIDYIKTLEPGPGLSLGDRKSVV